MDIIRDMFYMNTNHIMKANYIVRGVWDFQIMGGVNSCPGGWGRGWGVEDVHSWCGE